MPTPSFGAKLECKAPAVTESNFEADSSASLSSDLTLYLGVRNISDQGPGWAPGPALCPPPHTLPPGYSWALACTKPVKSSEFNWWPSALFHNSPPISGPGATSHIPHLCPVDSLTQTQSWAPGRICSRSGSFWNISPLWLPFQSAQRYPPLTQSGP